MRNVVLVALLAGSGCVTVTLSRTPPADDSVTVSPPGEDGARYVGVRSGRSTGAVALKRRWTKTATQACEGEFIAVSDGASETRRAGVVVARMHEGFVRCLLPSESQTEDKSDAKARDAAERRTTAAR